MATWFPEQRCLERLPVRFLNLWPDQVTGTLRHRVASTIFVTTFVESGFELGSWQVGSNTEARMPEMAMTGSR